MRRAGKMDERKMGEMSRKLTLNVCVNVHVNAQLFDSKIARTELYKICCWIQY